MKKGTSFSIQDILNSPVGKLNQHLNYKIGNTDFSKKNSKYKNIKSVDEFGNQYDSKKEMKRARELRLLLKAGEISFLAMQVEFDLGVAKYICDFMYTTREGVQVVEDVKSEATRKLPVYRLKRKLMLKIHQIKIREV